MRVVKSILIVFLFLLAITFSLQNKEEVTISYHGLVDTFVVPLFVVVVAAVCLGMIIGALGSTATAIKLHRNLRRQNKEIGQLKRDLEIPRNNHPPE